MSRKESNYFILLIVFLIMSSASADMTIVAAKNTKPSIWIQIYRIQGVDEIEGPLDGDPEWFYEIDVWDGEGWINYEYNLTFGNGVLSGNNTHTFWLENLEVNYTYFYITLYEKDYFMPLLPEVADISNKSGTIRVDQRAPAPQSAIYEGQYDVITNILSGDYVVFDDGYYKTSGEFDGSTDTDENDAELWFNIWDNYELPVADAGPNITGMTNILFEFNGSSSKASNGSSLVSYKWDFDRDGVFDANGPVVKHEFERRGVYEVLLQVTDSLGMTSVDTTTATIQNREPHAAFNYTPSDPTFLDTVYFKDASYDEDGHISSWLWEFGDGKTSQEANTSHVYSDKDTYIVSLTVTDDDGGTSEVTKEIQLMNLPPSSGFIFTPRESVAGEEVEFTDRSSDPENRPLLYLWDFGDGVLSTERNPTHTYNSSGTMTITLTVYDDEGVSDTTTKSIIVFPQVRPRADFSVFPEDATINNELNFIDTSEDEVGYIVTWLWDFGDGSTSVSKDTSHKFSDKGTHFVTLTVEDNDGNQDSITKPVVIKNLPPVADFHVSKERVFMGDEVEFVDDSTDPESKTLTYAWNFGDGSASSLQNPVHQYDRSGEFTVELSISDDEGATDSKSITIQIQEKRGGGIPGFPLTSIALGIIVSIIILILSKRFTN